MKKRDLIKLLDNLADDDDVEIEFRLKTGYDEGDIYSGVPETVTKPLAGSDKPASINCRWSLIGGW